MHTIKRHTLRLVDCNCPSQLDRILSKRANNGRFHLASVAIILALDILPTYFMHLNLATIFKSDKNLVLLQSRDFGNSSIHVTRIRVITTENDLRTNFQSKELWHWSIILFKVILNFGLITKLLFLDGIQFLIVDFFCHVIKRCQRHRVILIVRIH